MSPLPPASPAAPVSAQPLRTNVYIDGFNFYYGAVKGTPYKWLNFEKFLGLFRPKDTINRIYYFTARVDKGPHRDRQDTYLSALSTIPCISIIEGKFMHKSIKCRVAACKDMACDKFFRTAEEKRTDVNIAVYMLDDAYQNACDQFVLISGDSDLVPALHTIKSRFPQKPIILYVPARGRTNHAYELRGAADRAREVPLTMLGPAQFPARVPNGVGGFLEKPAGW